MNLFANNFETTLAVTADTITTTLTVADASAVPIGVSATDPFYITLQRVDLSAPEICKCTGVAGNVLTVERAQDGTAAATFPAGSLVEGRLVRAQMDEFTQQPELDAHVNDFTNPHAVTAAQAGADPAGSAAGVQTNLDTHVADLANPHAVTAAQAGAEPALGNPTTDGYVLSSTIAGVRSWVEMTGGGGGQQVTIDVAGITAAQANGSNAAAIGNNAIADGNNSVALGTGAYTGPVLNAIAIGPAAVCEDADSISIGFGASTNGDDSVIIGGSANGMQGNAVAIGQSARASLSSVAVGFDAEATASNTIAIGSLCQNSVTNSIKIASSISNGFTISNQGQFELIGGASLFVIPGYSTGTLPAAPPAYSMAYDETTNELKIFDVTWNAVGGGGGGPVAWGDITGTLSDQTDLQAELDAKAGLSTDNTFTGNFNVGDPGAESGGVLVNGALFSATAKINRFGAGVAAELILHRHSTNDEAHLVFSRSLGDTSTHVNVEDGRSLGDLVFTGWATDSYYWGASIRTLVDGTPSNTSMPARIDFLTSRPGTILPAITLSLRADGTAEFAGDINMGTNVITDTKVGEWDNKEDFLGNPTVDGYVLTSTVAGVRSWAPGGGGGSGEVNTSSNVGGGNELALPKVGVDLPFRTLIAGSTKITLTQNANDITFDIADAATLGAEPALGNPTADGYVLSSTIAGVRSWVAPSAGGGLSAVVDDPSPQLGGDLDCQGFSISLASGDLVFSGLGQKVVGNFSDGTFSNRLNFTTSVVDGNCLVGFHPNGAGEVATNNYHNNEDVDNSSRLAVGINATTSLINSAKTGTGTALPMTFLVDGTSLLVLGTDATANFEATTIVTPADAADDGLILKGNASQTGNLMEVRDSADAVRGGIGADGMFFGLVEASSNSTTINGEAQYREITISSAAATLTLGTMPGPTQLLLTLVATINSTITWAAGAATIYWKDGTAKTALTNGDRTLISAYWNGAAWYLADAGNYS